jgi:hypothetical protein
MVNEDVLSSPKHLAGLGLRTLTLMNQALLAKQFWRLLNIPSCLVAYVLKAKYFPKTDISNAKVLPPYSWLWKGIMSGKDLAICQTRWQVGCGDHPHTP